MEVQEREICCEVQDLGIMEYQQALDLQMKIHERVSKGGPWSLLLCEHPSVLTLGKLANDANILLGKNEILKSNIEMCKVNRGGDVTLHSLGQLVVYPIFNLKEYKPDIKVFLSKLEQVGIDLLRSFDIVANRFPNRTGIWVGNEKIASIGISVKKWTTFHGLALNVNTDLNLFSMIKPCGLDVVMTSIEKIKKQKRDMALVKNRVVDSFCQNFDLKRI